MDSHNQKGHQVVPGKVVNKVSYTYPVVAPKAITSYLLYHRFNCLTTLSGLGLAEDQRIVSRNNMRMSVRSRIEFTLCLSNGECASAPRRKQICHAGVMSPKSS